ncbi:MAG: polysaccharide biosynthesis C-terminal domain-containing protein, partial [Xanthobacteraceae bacterium]|nr:polysaccharide biosynthesis C-terminal domain-containing protein [Xanthobacteraceae bacterium]
YFFANVFSAVLGLANVVVFTRLFDPRDYGIYVLGMAFAIVLNTCLTSWLRLPILRENARGDGSDVRGTVLIGLVLSCIAAPVAYPIALLAGLTKNAAAAATAVAVMMASFEIGLEVLRAQQRALTFAGSTLARAIAVSVSGISVGLFASHGTLLLCSTALAFGLSTLLFAMPVWRGTSMFFERDRLVAFLIGGIPLTISSVLLALSGIIDRFIVAHLVGIAQAGRYVASADLANQALLMPAMSLASAFVPLAVQTLAKKGADAMSRQLAEGVEILFAIMLPACLGFAIVSHHLGDLALGPDFRGIAAQIMPIVSFALLFQILTQQYLHVSFLISNRNSFYLWNTGSVIGFNVAVSYILIGSFGVVGGAWGRLATSIFGFLGALLLTRFAFRMPLPLGRLARIVVAGLVMAVVVRALDSILAVSPPLALAILIPTGVISYAAMCWLQNVLGIRDHAFPVMRSLW